MNTIKSFWLGWGSVCVAGAGAYYFAKRDISANRVSKLDEQRKKREAIRNLEAGGSTSDYIRATASVGNRDLVKDDHAGSPSQEASQDPAPTRHAPVTASQDVNEKSKYETSTPFKAKKGDRFS